MSTKQQSSDERDARLADRPALARHQEPLAMQAAAMATLRRWSDTRPPRELLGFGSVERWPARVRWGTRWGSTRRRTAIPSD